MARVPEIIRRNNVSQVASQRPNPGAAWDALAQMASAGAQFAKPAAIEQATNEGLDSVYRDGDGVLKVDQKSALGGELADAHNSAAYARFLSQSQIDNSETFTELARQFEFDPEGFKSAADEYIKARGAETDVPSALRADLEQTMRREASQRFNGLYNAEIDRTQRGADQSTQTRRTQLANDYVSLYRAGDMEGAEEIYDQLSKLQQFRSSAAYIGETPEAGEAFLKAVRADAKMASMVYEISSASGTLEVSDELRTRLESLNDDPDLSPSQRQRAYEATQSFLKGVDAATIVNGLTADTYAAKAVRVESGGRSNAANPNSTALGQHQFIKGTWLEMVGKMRAAGGAEWANGLSESDLLELRTDPAISGQVFDFFTRQNEQVLSDNGLPINDTTRYMAHFFGAGGAVSVLSNDPSAALSDVVPAATITANPFLKNMTVQDAIDWAARKMTVKASDIAAQQVAVNQIPDREVRAMASRELATALNSRRAIENQSLLEYRSRVAQKDPMLTEREVMTDHSLSDQAQKSIVSELQKLREDETTGANTIARLNDPNASFNVADTKERNALDQAYSLAAGDAPPLSPDGLAAAGEIAVRTAYLPKASYSAVLGAITGSDPQSFATAAEFSNQVLSRQNAAFDRHTNEGLVKDRLADYSFYSQYYGAQEAAQKVIDLHSPEAVAKRKNLSAAAKEGAKDLEPAQVKTHMEGVYDKVEIPTDIEGSVLADYKRLYTDAFVQTGDSELAKNRALTTMQRIWGPNAVTGDSRLMKYPPQNFYPSSASNPNWMQEQIAADVNDFVFGDEATPPGGGLSGVVTDALIDIAGGANWVRPDNIRIMSDHVTRGEIAAGKSPSYTVIYANDGQIEQIPGRYRFEPPNEADAELTAQRAEDFAAARESEGEVRNLRLWREYMRSEYGLSESQALDRVLEDRDSYKLVPPPQE